MPLDDRLGRRIKLHNLRILRETIATGSMARAARRLAMTQPAVSYAIKEMEQVLGVALLHRSPQGVSPTVFGESLAERSIAIFNELRQGIDDIAFLADPTAGELRIGATPPMSAVAGAAIDRLIRRHPRMVFDLIVEPTEILMIELQRRGIELVISRMAEPIAPKGTMAEILFHDRLAVIAGRRSRWARKRQRLQLGDVVAGPWVLPPPEGFLGPMIRAAFESQGLGVPRASVTTASTYTLASLAALGSFLTIHPETMLRVPTEHPLLTALPIALSGVTNPIGLIRLKDRTPSPAAGLFAQELRAVVKAAGLGRGRVPTR
ncbi:MAG: LysR family transcriptional regulator [Reyranella sp.]|uniref:LysR family transcriptional regulator n=1 Tax=Reyranella sp. TaxID=1929291 RepID=UPI003D1433D4